MDTFDPDNYPLIREIKSPVTPEQLRPLDSRCQVVQFASPLSDADHLNLAKFLRSYPDIPLRIYGHYSKPISDLGFLCYYDFLKGFQADVWLLESTDGIEFLPPTLEFFGLGQTKSKKISLSILNRFPNLKELFLEGHVKDFENVGKLSLLEKLTIRSITLPSLSVLTSLQNLWSIAIKLGGTKDLQLLPQIGQLKYLELWMIKGLEDIESIGEVETLQNLFLETLKNVSKLPSLKKLHKLRRVALVGMKGLSDLSPLVEAPALEELCVGEARNLSVENFKPFVGHSTLKRASIGLCSLRKNKEVDQLLGLPKVLNYKTDFNFI
jgi:hypothetical protein